MSIKWQTLRTRIRDERDDKCQVCGVLGDHSRPQGLLHCHHILKWKSHLWLRYDRFYILLLCQKCHKKYEEIADLISRLPMTDLRQDINLGNEGLETTRPRPMRSDGGQSPIICRTSTSAQAQRVSPPEAPPVA